MASQTHYTERHGLTQKRSSGGGILFVLAAGLVVAGAGAAGLHYRALWWDEPTPSDQHATAPSTYEPSSATTLTGADEPGSSLPRMETVTDPDEKVGMIMAPAQAADAGATEAPAAKKDEAPKAKPVWHARPKPKPAAEDKAASDDAFSKPD